MVGLSPEQSDIKLYGGAAIAWNATDPEMVLDSGAGTGKSFLAMMLGHDRATQFPGSRHLFARQTRISLTETVLPDFEDTVLGHGHPAMHGNAARANRQKYSYPNRSEIVLAGLEAMADSGNPILSAQYDTITVFQGEETSEEIWGKLLSRLRNGKMPFQQGILDVNPSHWYHWINQRCFKAKCLNGDCPLLFAGQQPENEVGQPCEGCGTPLVPMLRRIQFRHQDNPRWYDHEKDEWKPDGVKYLQNLSTLPGATRRRLLNHEWCSEEGLVFDEFDPDVHVVSGKLNKDDQGTVRSVYIRSKKREAFKMPLEWFHASFDFGFRHPACLQIWGHDARDRLYLVAEVYKTMKDLDWWAETISELHVEFPFRTIIADSSDGGTGAHDMLQKRLGKLGGRHTKCLVLKADKVRGRLHGLDLCRVSLKVDEDGLPRTMFFTEALRYGRDKTLVDKKKPWCTTQEMLALIWRKSSDGRPVKDEPDPNCANHGVDAWCYGANWAWGKGLQRKRKPRTYKPGTIGYACGHDEVEGGRPTWTMTGRITN